MKNKFLMLTLLAAMIIVSPISSAAEPPQLEAQEAPASASKRITLKKTDVIGSQELPRVMSIISWKKTQPIDQPLLHKRSKMAFDLIEKKEFVREMGYREQMIK